MFLIGKGSRKKSFFLNGNISVLCCRSANSQSKNMTLWDRISIGYTALKKIKPKKKCREKNLLFW